MNHYLVVLHHTMDDLPLYITDDKDKAFAFADRTRAMPTNRIREVYGTDCSTPCNVCVVTFQRGRPIGSELVKLFE